MEGNEQTETQPDGQGPQPADQASGAGEQGQPNGVEQRISQLVAKHDQVLKQLEQKDAQIAELIGIATRQQPVQQVEAEPAIDIDPEEQKRISAILAPVVGRFERTIASLEQRLGNQTFQRMAEGEDPRVVEVAQRQLAFWRQDPAFQRYTEEDALVYATGIVAREAKRQGRNARGQFNALGYDLGGGSPPPPSQRSIPALPANFDDLSPDEQIKILEKRGAGSIPL